MGATASTRFSALREPWSWYALLLKPVRTVLLLKLLLRMLATSAAVRGEEVLVAWASSWVRLSSVVKLALESVTVMVT